MKEGIHPKYRDVIFKDISCDYSFKSKSTANSNEKMVWEDGKEYPVIKLEISSASHHFFTDKAKTTIVAGRVDKFKKKYKMK
jgi:large subunit ribosomal protein L31